MMGDIEQNDIENTCLGSEMDRETVRQMVNPPSLPSKVHMDFDMQVEWSRRIVRGESLWAEYFLLVNACAEIVSSVPSSVETMDEKPTHERLSEALDQLAKMLGYVLPGGCQEFIDTYGPRRLSERARELLATVADLKIQANNEPL